MVYAEFARVEREVFNNAWERISKDSGLRSYVTLKYYGDGVEGRLEIHSSSNKAFDKALAIFVEEYQKIHN